MLSGLLPNTTYHARSWRPISAGSRRCRKTSSSRRSTRRRRRRVRPVLRDHAGLRAVGQPQRWANLLGTVVDPDGIANAYFTVNGGARQALTIGDDDRRLEGPNAFNVEASFSDFIRGLNSVLITIVDFYGNTNPRR